MCSGPLCRCIFCKNYPALKLCSSLVTLGAFRQELDELVTTTTTTTTITAAAAAAATTTTTAAAAAATGTAVAVAVAVAVVAVAVAFAFAFAAVAAAAVAAPVAVAAVAAAVAVAVAVAVLFLFCALLLCCSGVFLLVVLATCCCYIVRTSFLACYPWCTHGVLLFQLVRLTGVSPFQADSAEDMAKKISQTKFDFPPKYFEHISQQAKDFISSLLVRNPR